MLSQGDAHRGPPVGAVVCISSLAVEDARVFSERLVVHTMHRIRRKPLGLRRGSRPDREAGSTRRPCPRERVSERAGCRHA